MAIIKRATNIKKIAYQSYIIKAKRINKISDKITLESASEDMSISAATQVNIKANET